MTPPPHCVKMPFSVRFFFILFNSKSLRVLMFRSVHRFKSCSQGFRVLCEKTFLLYLFRYLQKENCKFHSKTLGAILKPWKLPQLTRWNVHYSCSITSAILYLLYYRTVYPIKERQRKNLLKIIEWLMLLNVM